MRLGNYDFSRPVIYLAPMDGVSDAPFRTLCKSFGADITISEFIASDALIRDVKEIKRKIKSTEKEHPFGIQIFGNNAESLCHAAKIAENYNPDFIDINWGCPAKKIAGKYSGSGMLQNTPLLIDITGQIVKSVNIPVTVKTRVGYNDNSKPIVELAERFQDAGIKALSIHGRTKTQMYRGSADWELIGKVKSNPNITIPIIGNGDISSAECAVNRIKTYNLDGVMIGRGAMGNPWIFQQCKALLEGKTLPPEPDLSERSKICEKHFLLSIENKGEHRAMLEMRKHYKAYFKGLLNMKEYKLRLLCSTDIKEIFDILHEIQTL